MCEFCLVSLHLVNIIMENIKDTCFRYGPYFVSGLLAVGATGYIFRRILKPRKRKCGIDYPRDKVIVHQFAKGKYAPSLGHFVVKLETYLRMAKIPYEPFYSTFGARGPKGKAPWIEYNGTTMGDSQLIINYLNKELNVNLNKYLSPEERATAWAIQKWLEEFTYWLNVQTKWGIFYDDFYNVLTHPLPSILKPVLGRMVRKQLYAVGVGRHSNEEVGEMMKHDLLMLSELLGDKMFFMGDQPCELDCAAFGQLVQYLYQTPDGCPGKKLMEEKLTNLTEYIERMKNLYWPDWDERIAGK